MADNRKTKAAGSMVAQRPASNLRPVEDLAAEAGVTPPILAGLRRATGWAPGKQVTAEQFAAAVEQFNNRPMGGGRL
jgi:hypothetical protein